MGRTKNPRKRPHQPVSKKKLPANNNVASTSNAPNNQFEPLSDNDDMDSNPDMSARYYTSRRVPGENRMKPIIVDGIEKTALTALLNTTTSKSKAYFVERGNSLSVQTYSAADKDMLKKTFNEKQLIYHTFAEPEERHIAFVLKGYNYVQPDELKASLLEERLTAEHVKFIYKNTASPVYMVHFKKGTMTLSALKHLHFIIGRQKVSWDKPNSSTKRASQCTRCMAWGHSFNYCHRPERCIKCLNTHARGDCARNDTNKHIDKPSCVNCKMVNDHPANSPSCPEAIKYRKTIKSRQNRTSAALPPIPLFDGTMFPTMKGTPAAPPAIGTRPSTYAQALVSGSAPRAANAQPDAFTRLNQLTEELNEVPNLMKIINEVTDFMKRFKEASNEVEQKLIVLNFLHGPELLCKGVTIQLPPP